MAKSPRRRTGRVQKALPGMRQTRREALLELVKKYRQKLAIGAACYQAADALLSEIMAKTKVGKRVPIGDGLYAVVVDLFQDADKYFKPIAVKRYELQVQDASGRVVRMRDRKKD